MNPEPASAGDTIPRGVSPAPLHSCVPILSAKAADKDGVPGRPRGTRLSLHAHPPFNHPNPRNSGAGRGPRWNGGLSSFAPEALGLCRLRPRHRFPHCGTIHKPADPVAPNMF